MYYVLCNKDFALGGNFWISMFGRTDSFDGDS